MIWILMWTLISNSNCFVEYKSIVAQSLSFQMRYFVEDFFLFSVIGKITFLVNALWTFKFFKTLSMITSKKCDWHWERGGEGRYLQIANKKQYVRCSFKQNITYCSTMSCTCMGMNSQFKKAFLISLIPEGLLCLVLISDVYPSFSIYSMGC